MIKKLAVVDQIEVTRNNNLQIRIAVETMVGDEVVASHWHRTLVTPDTDVLLQMAAVNDHLAQMGCDPVTAEDIERIKRVKNSL